MAKPMSLEEAFTVAQQLSPLPSVAHDALQVLVAEIGRLIAVPSTGLTASEQARVLSNLCSEFLGDVTEVELEALHAGISALWAQARQPPAAEAGPKHGDDAGDGMRYVLCKFGFGKHWQDWLLIPHVDGQYVSAAKLPAFSVSILRHALPPREEIAG